MLIRDYQLVTAEPLKIGQQVYCTKLRQFAKVIIVQEFRLGPPNYVVECEPVEGVPATHKYRTTFTGAELMVPK
jgi:hypothetical protein